MTLTKKYLGLSALIAAALVVAAPFIASAHSDNKGYVKVKNNIGIGANIQHILWGTPLPNNATTTANGSIHTSATVTAVNGSTLTVTAKNGTTYTVNAANADLKGNGDIAIALGQIKVGDTVRIKGTVNGSTITATKLSDDAVRVRAALAANGAAGAGIVTSVTGSTFTIKPFGTKATTTVGTNASTTYRVNGDLASSSALQVGSKVVIAGNTNSDTSISASIVGIFSSGLKHFKHWFHF